MARRSENMQDGVTTSCRWSLHIKFAVISAGGIPKTGPSRVSRGGGERKPEWSKDTCIKRSVPIGTADQVCRGCRYMPGCSATHPGSYRNLLL